MNTAQLTAQVASIKTSKPAKVKASKQAAKPKKSARTAKPTKPAASAPTKQAAKPRVSTKEILRGLFPKVGNKHAVAAVYAACKHATPATVVTMCSDLANVKYCGPKGVIRIVKDGDHFVRQA